MNRLVRELRRTWCWVAHRPHHIILAPAVGGIQSFPFDYDAKRWCALCDSGGYRVRVTGLLAA